MKFRKNSPTTSFLILLIVLSVIFSKFGLQSVGLATAQSSELKPQFDFNVVYAYFQGFSDALVYNITYVSEAESSVAIIEVYEIEFSSGGHVMGSKAFGVCANDLPLDVLMGITISLPAKNSEIYGSGGWTTNQSDLRRDSVSLDVNTVLGIVFVSITRLGWITVVGNSTVRNLSSGVLIKQVQLEKFGNGFLYNALVSEEQLSHINLFNPTNSFNPNLPSPSPSPSQEPSKSSEPIYIRSDGSVDPSTAPIQRDGNVYTLTGNINRSIVVERDNIVVDGAGSALQGDGNGQGMELQGRNNVTIRNIEITRFFLGIYLNESSQVTTTRNNITSNHCGIVVHVASNNTISQNIIAANFVGIGLEGYYSVASSPRYNIISGNFISANVECGIFLQDSVSNSIVNNIIANNGNGTYIFASPFGLGSSNNTIYHNNFSGNVKQTYDTYWEHGFAEPMSINVWDNGKEGNYWSNYVGKDANGDGIGDTPYIIDGNNQDNYPLMNPVIIPGLPPIPTPRPSPIMIVAAIHMIATGVAVTLGVAIYRRKKIHY